MVVSSKTTGYNRSGNGAFHFRISATDSGRHSDHSEVGSVGSTLLEVIRKNCARYEAWSPTENQNYWVKPGHVEQISSGKASRSQLFANSNNQLCVITMPADRVNIRFDKPNMRFWFLPMLTFDSVTPLKGGPVSWRALVMVWLSVWTGASDKTKEAAEKLRRRGGRGEHQLFLKAPKCRRNESILVILW